MNEQHIHWPFLNWLQFQCLGYNYSSQYGPKCVFSCLNDAKYRLFVRSLIIKSRFETKSDKHLTLGSKNGNKDNTLLDSLSSDLLHSGIISHLYLLIPPSFRMELQFRFCDPGHDQGPPPCSSRWCPHCPVRPTSNDPVCMPTAPEQAGPPNGKHLYILTPWVNNINCLIVNSQIF